MVDFVPYSSNMHNDFELYSNNQEQHMDYPITNQPFLPTSSYSMEQSFNAAYDPMMHLTEGQGAHDLQYHYDAIAQGVKPFQYQTPAGSPHSTAHSFHEQPPVLSASSESGASVSSSALGSPTHYNDSWNSIGLGLTSSFEYPGMTASDKNFVGKSLVSYTSLFSASSSSAVCFTTPASAKPFLAIVEQTNPVFSGVAPPFETISLILSPQIDSALHVSQSPTSICRFPSGALCYFSMI
jgi:hypothetical protein